MTTIRQFIEHPTPAIDPRSIPEGKPLSRTLAQGTMDRQFGKGQPVLPTPAAFFKRPNLKGLPPFSALWSQPRTWLRNR